MNDRLEQLLKLHAADPDDADLPYMIALEHGKADDTEQAIAWLDKTLALNANYHYAYFQKAKMLDADGEANEALAVLDVGIAKASAAGDAKALGELRELRSVIDG